MCTTCQIFEAYQTHAQSSMDTLVAAVHGPFLAITLSLVGIWATWIGIQMFIGTLDMASALKQVFFLVLGFGVFLGIQGGLIGQVFNACIDVMGGLSSAIMGGSGGTSGMTSLLTLVEESIVTVFDAAVAIMGSGSAWTGEVFVTVIYGIALIIPYMFLLILFLSHSAVSLFRLTLIFGVSPFLIGMSAFPFGRNLIGAGVRTIVGSIATMLCITTVFSIVVSSVTALGIGAEADMNPDEYMDLGSGRFLLALIMGWLGTALISEAVNIAGQLSNSILGTVSAGILSAGAMRGGAIGMSAGRTAAGYGGKVGGVLHDKVWEKPKPRPGHILETAGA